MVRKPVHTCTDVDGICAIFILPDAYHVSGWKVVEHDAILLAKKADNVLAVLCWTPCAGKAADLMPLRSHSPCSA